MPAEPDLPRGQSRERLPDHTDQGKGVTVNGVQFVRATFSSRLMLALVVVACLGFLSCEPDPDTIFPTATTGTTCYEDFTHPCLADAAPHTVFVEYLGPRMRTATTNTLNGSSGTTDLGAIFFRQGSPVIDGESETDDVYLYDYDYRWIGLPLEFDTVGMTVCDDTSIGNSRCAACFKGASYLPLDAGANYGARVRIGFQSDGSGPR